MSIAPVDVMDVKDIMKAEPRTCTPDTTVAEAASLMWEADCGVLPVVDEGELVGIVTDRDMYIALATQNERAAVLRVGAVATTDVITCRPDDNVRHALETMRRARVRRLPVVGERKTLLGILSISDIVRSLDRNTSVSGDDVVETLQVICTHPNVGAETERRTETLQQRALSASTRQRARPNARRGAASTTPRTRDARGRVS
jgi:CBS domain-containing protein